jgi:putative transcriptional regulator
MKITEVKGNQPGPHKGGLLLSEPFLEDPNFRRTVVLLCEHNEEGSVGFVVNRLLSITTAELVPDLLEGDYPVFYGGPVEPNTLHYLYQSETPVSESRHVSKDMYWGGNIAELNTQLQSGELSPAAIRFFVGYSGWAPEQLEEEISQLAWWTARLHHIEWIFNDDLDDMWPTIVKHLGKDFAHMANAPEDPQWN